MGVPKFFRYISERYPCLSELVRESQVPEFDNLYLDMNGIIHNCSHPNDNDIHFRITEEQIFKDIFYYLETLFNMIKPQKLFFLAVDGVAPRAKMNQQRGRRFRSAKDAEIAEKKAREKGEKLPEEARFDSNCITPGTPFMCRLDNALRYFIQQKISTSKAWRNCKVILSGHQTPGEGEHKIMEYIRYLKSQKKYDPNTRHCLYGLDADLIMLGLCSHEKHFSLLREEVKFGKKNNKVQPVDQQRFFLLHLSLMRDYLELEFQPVKESLKFDFDIEKIIDDWVLMGFLVGNDFIPHIPNLHIQTDALPMLFDTYMKTLPKLDGYINEGGYLNLPRLQIYIENLSKFDRDTFSNQYEDLKFLETKHQAGFNTRNDVTFGGNQDLLDLVKATEFEFDSPDENDDEFNEVFQNEDNKGNDGLSNDEIFEKEFFQHRRNYYISKLKYEEMTPEVLAEQARIYITALQWTLSYYYHGVQSWSYFYPYHYAPYISDVRDFKDFKINFELGNPFLPFQQLMSVLPAGSKDHVPNCYKQLMTHPDSELIDFYPADFETDLNGKNQEWEAVVLIPFIDEERLLKSLKKYDNELTPEEKKRNVHGPMYVYAFSSTSQGSLEGPENFPSIGSLFCKEEKVYREEIQVPKEKLVLGPSKGALTNVYFTGFPTLKHLKYHSELRPQHVKVFDQPSRKDNMIVVVEPRIEMDKPIEILVKELMSKIVFVGWPHLIEAKIVRITNKDITFFSDGNSDKTDAHKWKVDIQAIKDHHANRMGIDPGEITAIVHVLQATGEEYRFDSKIRMFRTVRTWNRVESAYPIQCIVTDVRAYRKKFKEELSLFEAFKVGTEIIMLTNPYYGYMGEIVETNCYEKTGRVKVCLTVQHNEPTFTNLWQKHLATKDSYMNSYQTSTKLNISENVLNRITGTVLVIAGLKRQISEGQSKMNIGLQMKFAKQNEELAGYTKKERLWLYSDKVLNLVQEYYCKFPRIFEVMENRTSRGNNDVYFESDFFETTEGEDNLSSLMKWLNQLPHMKAERRTIGSEAIEKEIVDEIAKQVMDTKDMPMKKVTMQVKPHLIYAPALSKTTTKAPDFNANYQLFDRVVVARETEKYSVGMKGTVIGINRVKDLNPVRQDCINREDIYCEILFDNLNGDIKTGRLIVENLVNITHGQSLIGIERFSSKTEKNIQRHENSNNELLPKHTESFSTILQNKNRNQNNSGPQKNQNFTDIWNALKTGNQIPTEAITQTSTINVIQNVSAAANNDTYTVKDKEIEKSKIIDSQKKLSDAINKKMEELAVNSKKKMSPVPNDQSVPIMISPPIKLPTPPKEWLESKEEEFPMANITPRLKLEMPTAISNQQMPPQNVFYGNSVRPPPFTQMNFPHPVPIYPTQQLRGVRMHQPIPLMSAPIITQPQQTFFKNNEHHVGPYFANNQQPRQQQQRYYNNNNSNNTNNKQGKYRQNQYQQQPITATVAQSNQQNPFIPLQAARKSTKGKETSVALQNTKESIQVLEVFKKTEQNSEIAPSSKPVSEEVTNEKKDTQEAEKPASVVDPRKSRLAIKF
ncbi:5'-3' exoribonuclease 1 [Chironomus tepperi]|uniref:5'-3' exoribonuclease 1 n=1 Tax=Chironomus tepperi TaxID=113505 RepID=UPI00391EF107